MAINTTMFLESGTTSIGGTIGSTVGLSTEPIIDFLVKLIKARDLECYDT